MQTNNKPQRRRIPAPRLRELLHELADDICNARELISFTMRGNTFELHIDGGTINISINEPRKGGEQ